MLICDHYGFHQRADDYAFSEAYLAYCPCMIQEIDVMDGNKRDCRNDGKQSSRRELFHWSIPMLFDEMGIPYRLLKFARILFGIYLPSIPSMRTDRAEYLRAPKSEKFVLGYTQTCCASLSGIEPLGVSSTANGVSVSYIIPHMAAGYMPVREANGITYVELLRKDFR